MMVSARLTPEAKAALIRQHLDDGVPLTRLAAAAGLQRQERSDLGRRRLPEDLVEALALRRAPPTTAYVHRIGDLARDRDLPAPNSSTVRSGGGRDRPGVADPRATGTRPTATSSSWSTGVPRPVQRAVAGRPHPVRPSLLDLQVLDVKQQPARPWLTIGLDDYSAQLVADAAASSALQVAHATTVEGYPPVPGATMVRAGRSQPWLVVAAGVDRVALADLAGQVAHVPRRTVLPDPPDPGALPVGALDQA